MSRKSIKKSFQKSAEYSAALVLSVLFLFSSIYSLPNFSVTKSSDNGNEPKNSKTTAKVDTSYRKYCASSDNGDSCDFIAINTNVLDLAINPTESATWYQDKYYAQKTISVQSIRAPPFLPV